MEQLAPVVWSAIELAATSRLTISSRWKKTSEGSLLSAWSGSSIRFIYSGSALELKFGSRTERKDRWNGGTQMLECSVIPTTSRSSDLRREQIRRFDAELGFVFSLPLIGEKCTVCVTHIDWASVVEVESFLVGAGEIIEPFTEAEQWPTVMVMGDSISCGYAPSEKEPILRGCLDAFPHRAQRILADTCSLSLNIELVAYPGASLVEPTDEECADGIPFSILTKFFDHSPWSHHKWEISGMPTVIVIALGTNDESNDVSFDRFIDELNTFNKTLIKVFPSVKDIWLIPPFEDFNETGHSEFRQHLLSGSHAVHFSVDLPVRICDLQNVMTKDLTVDGLHPTVKGQEILANSFAEFARLWFGAISIP
ncbi:uncharacterized protein FIBRA_08024 [Fibroporia radiculosa]|uniref:Uncharacterized protein n=1 Tax=Fibroporia radiculosa TaxID=599839 RepID=J4IC49_9APHY|nr:uncharacterized protein FIBRA_08024 [Fibroporia radiculosa]CCM05791.1 predicted protein [Fibroporia radiculosa]